MSAARNPVDVLASMQSAFASKDTPRDRVLAVRDAMLTLAERVAVDRVAESDQRSDVEFAALEDVIRSHLDASRYTVPELFFRIHHAGIANAILRPEEIASINDLYC